MRMLLDEIWQAIEDLPGTTPTERALKKFKSGLLRLSASGGYRNAAINIRFGNQNRQSEMTVNARLETPIIDE